MKYENWIADLDSKQYKIHQRVDGCCKDAANANQIVNFFCFIFFFFAMFFDWGDSHRTENIKMRNKVQAKHSQNTMRAQVH